VKESLQECKRLEAPEPEAPASKTKKPRASKNGNVDEATQDVPEPSIASITATSPGNDAAYTVQEASTPAPKGRKKRAAAKGMDANEDEKSAPKKKRGRASKKVTAEDAANTVDDATQVPTPDSMPAEEVGPAVAKIEALAADMRAKAGHV
jgi:hypothetical protein